jgi:hypothetical protein
MRAWPSKLNSSFDFRLDFTKPRLNASEKVRLAAIWTAQHRVLARQSGEAVRVQVDVRVDLVSGRGTNESKHGH